MPLILKQVNNYDGEEPPALQYFPGTVRIGSKSDCDFVVRSREVLPFHGEIYHRGNEYRFVAAQSAFVQINDQEVLTWPAVLSDGDVLTIGDTKLQFKTLPPIPKRSWRASFAAFLAVTLFSLLLLFEISIMIWLPYTLHKTKTWALASAKQDIVMRIDRLRDTTRGLKCANSRQGRIKSLLLNCEDSIAQYSRDNLLRMNQEQTKIILDDLTQLEAVADSWDRDRELYGYQEKFNPKAYIDKLCRDLKEQTPDEATL